MSRLRLARPLTPRIDMRAGFTLRRLACVTLAVAGAVCVSAQSEDQISAFLRSHQMDLASEGRAFLVDEGSRVSFFLVGGLHGDNETNNLVQALLPRLAPFGYRYAAAEMSAWTANRFFPPANGAIAPVWGLDIEEGQPDALIRELAAANPQSRPLQSMSALVKERYRRSQAPQLSALAGQVTDIRDRYYGDVSLLYLIQRTLAVESERLDPSAELSASVERESFMKQSFVLNYRNAMRADHAAPKVVAAFGQNHMHRGIDHRGVSTLGNFIAEFAAAERTRSFHLAIFAAGGKINVGGLLDADQRKDQLAFELLASAAKFPATVFDVRPLRQQLRRLPSPLSARDANLSYWADSYDAIVCYREVTPLAATRPQ